MGLVLRNALTYFFLLAIFHQNCSAEEWCKVNLATYPRSGNHWLRYLIEEATGVATSSVYCDQDKPKSHLRTPFQWGGYCAENGYEGNRAYPIPGEIVVIKTHYPVLVAPFDAPTINNKTIVVVRNPIDSIFSFYCYMHDTPTSTQKKIPQKELELYVLKWKSFVTYWSERENVQIYRYEDLLKAPSETFSSIMKEIGYDVKESDIERAVNRYPPEGEPYKHLNKYSQKQLVYINNHLNGLMKKFHYRIPAQKR